MDITAELRPAWRTFFDRETPNDVILSAALAGRCPALAFVDRADSPSQIVIRVHGGKAFAGTGVSESFLHGVVDRFETFDWTALADTGVPDRIRERGRVVARTRFDRCDLESASLRLLRDRLSSDHEMLPLDRDLLKRCHHAKRELAKEYGEKVESYFDIGYGICLLYRERIVSEAYMGYVVEGRGEAIVGTVETFRGRGLASIASAFLAEEARQRGHEFTWSCLSDNIASLTVARRLGFRRERPYSEIYY